jgi:hypothetical protein
MVCRETDISGWLEQLQGLKPKESSNFCVAAKAATYKA